MLIDIWSSAEYCDFTALGCPGYDQSQKRVGWDEQTGCWWAVGRGFGPVCDGPPTLRDLVPPYGFFPEPRKVV